MDDNDVDMVFVVNRNLTEEYTTFDRFDTSSCSSTQAGFSVRIGSVGVLNIFR